MFNQEEVKPLYFWGRIVLIVLAVFLVAQALYTLTATGNIGKDVPPTSLISVTGESEVFAVPDTASLSFGAQATEKTVAEAQKKVTEKVNRAIEMLKKAGVEEKDIKNTNYNIAPHYEYPQIYCIQAPCPPSRQTLTGYDVEQMITVKIRNTADVGSILGQLGSLELTNVSGVSFMIDDEDELRAEARQKAIDQAQEKAEKLADELGVKLGRITNFYESGDNPMYYAKGGMYESAMAANAPGAITPDLPMGQNKIVSNVTITYEIK